MSSEFESQRKPQPIPLRPHGHSTWHRRAGVGQDALLLGRAGPALHGSAPCLPTCSLDSPGQGPGTHVSPNSQKILPFTKQGPLQKAASDPSGPGRFYNLDSQPATRTRVPPATRSGGGRGPGSLPLEPGPFCPQQLVLHTPVGTLGRPPRLLPVSFRLKRFPWQGRGALVEKPGPDPLAHRGGRLRTPPPRPG